MEDGAFIDPMLLNNHRKQDYNSTSRANMADESFRGSMPLSNRNKRTHDQISTDDPRPDHYWLSNLASSIHNAASSSSLFAAASSSSLFDQIRRSTPSIDYLRAGFDYRRPVMSQPLTTNVVDLTNEPDSPPPPRAQPSESTTGAGSTRASRLPRFPGNVIDLSEEDSDEGFTAGETAFEEALRYSVEPTTSSSNDDDDDVELLYTVAVPGGTSRPSSTRPAIQGPHPPRPLSRNLSTPSFEHMRSRFMDFDAVPTRGGRLQAVEPQDVNPRPGPSLLESTMIRNARMLVDRHLLRPVMPQITGNRTPLSVDDIANFRAPNLDYEQQPAFPIHRRELSEPGRHLPTYTTPGKPRDGYTRSAGEDDAIVCPNCDEELGVGGTDIKRQCWISKKCGHVYCGTCTMNRHKKSKRPRVEGTPTTPFSRCVVPDCKTAVSSATCMLQIYL